MQDDDSQFVQFLARDAFARTNRRAIAMMFVRLSVRRDLSSCWIVQCSGHPDTKACPPTSSRLFPVPSGRLRHVWYGCANYAWYLKRWRTWTEVEL